MLAIILKYNVKTHIKYLAEVNMMGKKNHHDTKWKKLYKNWPSDKTEKKTSK